jgi:hypothetical protein
MDRTNPQAAGHRPGIAAAIANLVANAVEDGLVSAQQIEQAMAAPKAALRGQRGSSASEQPPPDLISQAQAAGRLGISRQTVNQWVFRGELRAFKDEAHKRLRLVSFADVAMLARRKLDVSERPDPRKMIRQFTEALASVGVEDISEWLRAHAEQEDDGRKGNLARNESNLSAITTVLSDLLRQGLGANPNEELSDQGQQAVKSITQMPSLDYLLRSESKTSLAGAVIGDGGYQSDRLTADSLGSLLLSLLSTALAPCDEVGSAIRRAAEELWGGSGSDWRPAFFGLCYLVDEQWPVYMIRHSATEVYLRSYGFYRSTDAASSFTFSQTSGYIDPTEHYGKGSKELDDRIGVRLADLADKKQKKDANPFRPHNFGGGITNDSVLGIRYYQYDATETAKHLKANYAAIGEQFGKKAQDRYRALAVELLAEPLSKEYVEFSAVDNFDWWKRRLTRNGQRQQMISLRGETAKRILHAITLCRVGLRSEHNELHQLQLALHSFDFNFVAERYEAEKKTGKIRIIRDVASKPFTREEATKASEREIARLLSLYSVAGPTNS